MRVLRRFMTGKPNKWWDGSWRDKTSKWWVKSIWLGRFWNGKKKLYIWWVGSWGGMTNNWWEMSIWCKGSWWSWGGFWPRGVCVWGGGGVGWGGGYSLIFFLCRLGPSIYCLPQIITGKSGIPNKIFYILAPPPQKNISILYLDLKKRDLKCIEMTPKIVQFCEPPPPPPPNIHNFFIPPKIFIFLKKTKEILKFEILNPVYLYMKISKYPLWSLWL